MILAQSCLAAATLATCLSAGYGWAAEPNNTPQTATPAIIGEEAAAVLDALRDVDVFRYVPKADGILILEVIEKPPVHQLFVWWMNDKGETIRGNERDVRVEKAKPVFLAIKSAKYDWDEKTSPDPIRFRITLARDPFPGEPNDKAETAQAISVGEAVRIAFMPRLDTDFLAVTAPGDGKLKLNLLENPAKHQVFYWWQDEAGASLGGKVPEIKVARGQRVLLALKGGQYEWYETSSPLPVGLRIDFEAIDLAEEPNNTIETATPGRLDAPTTFALTPLHDVDVFRFTAPGDGVLKYTVLEKPDVHTPHVVWMREDGTPIAEASSFLYVGKGNTYYAAFRSTRYDWDEKPSSDPVRVQFSFAAEGDAFEPNDTLAEAKPFPSLSPWISLFPAADRDVFRIDAVAGSVLTLGFKPASHGRTPRVSWLAPDGQVIAEGLKPVARSKEGPVYLQIESDDPAAPNVWAEGLTPRLNHARPKGAQQAPPPERDDSKTTPAPESKPAETPKATPETKAGKTDDDAGGMGVALWVGAILIGLGGFFFIFLRKRRKRDDPEKKKD